MAIDHRSPTSSDL